MKFENISDAVAVASHVEQLHNMEQNWLMNRLNWLLLSQAFCIAAYVDLITSNVFFPGMGKKVEILVYGLPMLGILTCTIVGLSIRAADRVMRRLADQRAEISKSINELVGTDIPLLGSCRENRHQSLGSTLICGSLPHYLPWFILLLWLALFFKIELQI